MKLIIFYFFMIFLLLRCSESSSNKDKSVIGKEIQAQVPKKTINIIGHWLNEGKREDLVRELVNEYEFLHQEIKVNLVFPNQIYWTRGDKNCEINFVSKILKEEKQPWDVIRINDDYYGIASAMHDPEWSKKYLVDFSTINEFRQNTIKELTTDTVKAKWRGIIPGPFLEGFNWSIWYNRKLAEKIGIKVKQFDMTCDDFLEYIKAVDDYNKKGYSYIIPFFENTTWSTIYTLGIQAYISEIGDINELNNDSYNEKKLKAWHKTLTFIETLSKYNAWNYDWKRYKWEETCDLPLKKKVLFYLNASWMYNIWQKIDNNLVNDMVPAELPQFKQSSIYSGGYMITWAVPQNATNKEEAIQFLLFLNRPDVAEKWLRYTKCPTGIKGGFTPIMLGNDQFEDFNFIIQQKYGMCRINYVDDARLVLGASRQNIDLHLKEVAYGLITADQAMLKIRQRIKTS